MSIQLPTAALASVAFMARLTIFGANASTWVRNYSSILSYSLLDLTFCC